MRVGGVRFEPVPVQPLVFACACELAFGVMRVCVRRRAVIKMYAYWCECVCALCWLQKTGNNSRVYLNKCAGKFDAVRLPTLRRSPRRQALGDDGP